MGRRDDHGVKICVLVRIFCLVMDGDREELVFFEGACFEDLLSELEVETDTLAASYEQVVYQVEFCIFEA